jgi:cell division protein ZapA (FtsZ GTPase activity inhibitor)
MKFEDAGRALDREIDKLRNFIESDVRPQTRQEMAEFLRKAADRLAKLAERLDKPQQP